LPVHQSPWFALRIRHRCEQYSTSYLSYHGFTVCFPTYEVERRWSDRVKQLQLPLFPGYIFCQMAPGQKSAVLSAPGVVQLVSIGNTPVPVEPAEMEGVLRSVECGFGLEPAELPRPEDRVLILSGPFRGLEGVFVERRKQRTLILSVTLLQRAIAVELDATAVRPVNKRPRPRSGPLNMQLTPPQLEINRGCAGQAT
jgi:transcription antitermination factor NusG